MKRYIYFPQNNESEEIPKNAKSITLHAPIYMTFSKKVLNSVRHVPIKCKNVIPCFYFKASLTIF